MSARDVRNLDEMIGAARELDAGWDVDRSERVREGALRRRDARMRRDRGLRRAMLVAGGAGLLVLALLRAAASAPAEPLPSVASSAPSAPAVPTPEALAARAVALNDAGYARD